MSLRLSNKQRIVLEDIESAPGGLLYINNITTEVHYSWRTESERRRWLESLQSRSLIEIDRGMFLRLTLKGSGALKAGDRATRRDFQAEEVARQKAAGIYEDEPCPQVVAGLMAQLESQ